MAKPGTLSHVLQMPSVWNIARRYFVVNGFDGALTMLGLVTGFEFAGGVDLDVVIGACVATAVALGVSGVSSAYLSESAERQRRLSDLENAMLRDLSGSAHGATARRAAVLVAVVNGAAPLFMAAIIVAPLGLANLGVPVPGSPLHLAIGTGFVCIFGLGVFLGRVAGRSPLGSAVKAVLIAAVTFLLILLLEPKA